MVPIWVAQISTHVEANSDMVAGLTHILDYVFADEYPIP